MGAQQSTPGGQRGSQQPRRDVPASHEQDWPIPGLRVTAWDQQDVAPRYPKLEANTLADVVVVGGGIMGLNVAYQLVRAGKRVVLLEARAIGSGQSGKTTAHLMPWNDDYYSEIQKLFGDRTLAVVGDAHRGAIDEVEKIVMRENISCKFRRIDGFLMAENEEQSTLKTLQAEYEASQAAGFNDIQLLHLPGTDPSLGKMTTAIRFPNSADFHPLMYMNGLAQAIVRLGGQIYEMSRVVNTPGRDNTVTTANGFSVRAGAVVLATNSPINHNLAIHARQTAYRSYVVGLKLPKDSVKHANWWDTHSPYHYVRTEEKEGYDVLIVGGEDHPVGIKPQEYYDAWGRLEAWARERWTMAEEVVYMWTGMVFEPVDLLHFFGKDPLDPLSGNCYIATGDSGQGFTGGTIAGIVISSAILGQPHLWAEAFSPSRVPPVGMSVLQSEAHEVANTLEGYSSALPFKGVDWLDIEDLAPGRGAVLQKGIHKVAVYKGEDGTSRKFSAVCPHMKCIVKYNPNDHTFDCPCHGSIFDDCGRCINGPAKMNLTPIA